MTSRNSFFKLMREDLRQRLWTIVLAFIVFVLPIPIAIAMGITTAFNESSLVRYLVHVLQANNVWLALVTVVGAAICAVSGFGYLFSKKKVDFFHSLPVKRERLFMIRYINGVLVYLVPYLTMLLVSFLIIGASGSFDSEILVAAMEGLLVHFLGYLTMYTTFILSVVFVGNIVVFFCVSGWNFGITAVTVLMYCAFEENFFKTFSYRGDGFLERMNSLRFLSPGYFYLRAVEEAEISMLLQQLLCTAVLFALALFAYRVRSSEGAGKAIAFPILKPVFRVSIELLAGAFGGMLFYMATDSRNDMPGWMVFGAVLGVVLSHIFIESVYHYDIRKCFSDKISLAVCAVISVGFVLAMRYDVFGYDTYIPDKGKVASVSVEVNRLNGYSYSGYSTWGSFVIYGRELEEMTNSSFYLNGSVTAGRELEEMPPTNSSFYPLDSFVAYDREFKEMALTNMDIVYPYLETLIKDTQNFYHGSRSYNGPMINVNVTYRLKNGRTIYRNYISFGMREEVFAQVFESLEYKTFKYFDVYNIPAGSIQTVQARCAMNERTMTLSLAENAELMKNLQREVSALTLKERLEKLPVALLTVAVRETEYVKVSGEGVQYYSGYYEIPLYASYTETLRFLEARGFSAEKKYEWTGMENMYMDSQVMYFYDKSSDGINSVAWPADTKDGLLEVKREDWQALYELCDWRELLNYTNPTESIYDDYWVYLDIPAAGYNTYDRYEFKVDKDADLSFLFD